ncbi:hypothetical protein VTO42DRAFT_4738 [Malbranchea cinnamomea]
MGKPRMIILVRHAQSEGNKNRDIHQTVPDHRVKLTPEGWKQAEEAGRRLRAMLRPDDTLHFFTSPYRRTRETTEGMLRALTSDDPTPSPYQRESIKVYEEPRLREQDFGNFQPCSAEMERMWQERADYGHFFYRIPNGESAADAYDRISGFNETLWRLFGEENFASVCVLVTHGLMARIFLMKWYHFSVEYFEDLRNINHCEFVIMEQNPDTGKYLLRTQLRTWSELKKAWALKMQREKAANLESSLADTSPPVTAESSIQPQRKWGGCPNGCDHAQNYNRKRKPLRKNTRDLLYECDQKEREKQLARSKKSFAEDSQPEASVQDSGDRADEDVCKQPAGQEPATSEEEITMGLAICSLAGRDGGGSQSGVEGHFDDSKEIDASHKSTTLPPNVNKTKNHRRRQRAKPPSHRGDTKGGSDNDNTSEISPGLPRQDQGRGTANSLGDRDDDDGGDEGSRLAVCQRSLEIDKGEQEADGDQEGVDSSDDDDAHEKDKRYDQSIRGSVY